MRGTTRGNTMMVIAVTLASAGCSSTPRHSNTLMFGTSTRVALDVSQEPTGSVGFTLATNAMKRYGCHFSPTRTRAAI